MFSPARFCLVALSLSPLPVLAADQCTASPPPSKYFAIDAGSGSPILVAPTGKSATYTFSNESNVLVRVQNINPFAFKCSVTSTSQDYKETAISSFLGLIGGVANVGAQTPKAGSPTPTSTVSRSDRAPDKCYTDTAQSQEAGELQGLADAINSALVASQANEKQMINAYNDALLSLRLQTRCNDIVSEGSNLIAIQPFTIAPAQPDPNDASTALPLDQAIDSIAAKSRTLLANLTDNLTPSCKQDAKATIDRDSDFLASVAHGTTSNPAAADKWRTQLTTLKAANTNLDNSQTAVRAVLANRQNFTIDTQLHGDQQKVTLKVSCSAVPLQELGGTKSSDPSGQNKPATGAQAGKDSSNDWSHDFSFGPGPRFVLSGGVVVSPLAAVTYSTSSNPASPPPNIVVLQQNSSTRVLPIAILSGRFWDQLPPRPIDWLPNYLSFGVTAKSDPPKGTNIEYLFGPSWALAARQLFITAGAYAGQQQRLGGGLYVGEPTTLSSANLPITQKTIWKAGFAITWAPAGK